MKIQWGKLIKNFFKLTIPQILDRAGVSTMDPVSSSPTDWTRSSTHDAFTREDQVRVLLLRRKQPKATQMRKKSRERQQDTLSESKGKKILTLLFYHISVSLEQAFSTKPVGEPRSGAKSLCIQETPSILAPRTRES